MSIAQPNPQLLPFSPLASPAPDHTAYTESSTPMERSPSVHPFSYAPFRSSPLATSSTTATIRHISETGEMEMEDPEEQVEEMETDDVFTMDDLGTVATEDRPEDMSQDGLASINIESLFRAGTPTPSVTPPTATRWVGVGSPPQRQRIQGTETDDLETAFIGIHEPEIMPLPFSILVENSLNTGTLMEEDIALLGDIIESSHEISTEELDTECMVSLNRTHSSSGHKTSELLELLAAISPSKAATAGRIHEQYRT